MTTVELIEKSLYDMREATSEMAHSPMGSYSDMSREIFKAAVQINIVKYEKELKDK